MENMLASMIIITKPRFIAGAFLTTSKTEGIFFEYAPFVSEKTQKINYFHDPICLAIKFKTA